MSTQGTVVIPVLNGEDGLFEAINSVLETSSSDWSVIVSDNASGDGSKKIAKEFMKSGRVKLVSWPTTAPVLVHFALALEQVNTELVCLLGHDDELKPGYLEAAAEFLQGNLEVAGVIPQVTNVLPDGSHVIGLDAAKLARTIRKDSGRDSWFYRRRFPEVNVIYGVWRTEFLRACFQSVTVWVDVSNPFSDRALATSLLRHGQLVALPTCRLLKRVRPSSIQRLSLAQEFTGYRQIMKVLNSESADQCGFRRYLGLTHFFRAIFVSCLASARAHVFVRYQREL